MGRKKPRFHLAAIDPVQIWPFERIPQWVRDIIGELPNGGDEDWVAVLPAHYRGELPKFLDIPPFKISHNEIFKLHDGSLILVGCHS